MNIYDEALKDFNTLVGGEELKELIEYPPNGNWHKLYSNVIACLQRAKKVEMENFTIQELKELLKGLNVKKGNKTYLIINDTLQYYEDDEELEKL